MSKLKVYSNHFQKRLSLARARKEFHYFCRLRAPDFYKKDREYLKTICDEFQSFYEGEEDVLIVNAPPRHGKSRTASLFVEWALGKNVNEKIMTASYNEVLSTMFSKNVRNGIQTTKADENTIVYSDIFSDTRIKYGEAAMNLWSLEGGYNNYLATSPTGTATGFGCSLFILDDLIKNKVEAYNDNVLEGHWDWFVNTITSRLEEGGKIIIIMTRWATGDLAGRALNHFKTIGQSVRHINMKALKDDGTMLCEEVLSLKSYRQRIKTMDKAVSSANYQQSPIDIAGRLYSKHKTYDTIPTDNEGNPLFVRILNYTDTADEGSDYLSSIVYGETFDKEAYILDVLYTKEPMEITEPQTAKMLYNNKVNEADVESNNGGRGFARNVERELKEEYETNKTIINWFHQSQNKKARILSNATWVMEHVYFPNNWADRWPDFYNDVMKYQREGKNAHDDGPDTLTGIAEKLTGDEFGFSIPSNTTQNDVGKVGILSKNQIEPGSLSNRRQSADEW